MEHISVKTWLAALLSDITLALHRMNTIWKRTYDPRPQMECLEFDAHRNWGRVSMGQQADVKPVLKALAGSRALLGTLCLVNRDWRKLQSLLSRQGMNQMGLEQGNMPVCERGNPKVPQNFAVGFW